LEKVSEEESDNSSQDTQERPKFEANKEELYFEWTPKQACHGVVKFIDDIDKAGSFMNVSSIEMEASLEDINSAPEFFYDPIQEFSQIDSNHNQLPRSTIASKNRGLSLKKKVKPHHLN